MRAPPRREAPWQRIALCWQANPLLAAVVAFALLLGLLLRLYALGRGTIDADQAVVGLMAREILHGHFFAFYWGVNYGGTEAYAVALVFALFGSSAFTLGLTPVLLCAGSIALLWRVGNRMFASPVGALAAVAFWVWPEAYVTYYHHGDGFRWIILLCGLTVFLTALRIGDGEGRRADWLAFGLGAGVGWLSSPEIVYFLAPAGVYLVARLVQRRAKVPVSSLLTGVAALIVGSLPWWWHNFNQHFDSLASPPQAVPPGPGGAYWWHLGIFERYVVPLVLGLRRRGDGLWLGPTSLTPHLVNVAIFILLAWLVYLAARGRAWLLVLYLAAFPFLYAAQPYTWFWQDGRYGIFLAPGVALAVASLLCRAGTWVVKSPRAAPAVVAALVLVGGMSLTLGAARHEAPYERLTALPAVERTSWFSWHANPNNLPTALAQSLVRWHVHDAFSSYWLGYDVGFLSAGGVTVSPAGPAFIRYAAYYRAIAASRAPAWIFVRPAANGRAASVEAGTSLLDPGCSGVGEPCLSVPDIVQWCVIHHISYAIRDCGPYVVVLPSRRVLPAEILPWFGI
ncbi:MAG: glycosyltransferase family 39 protein [Acidimicrobiales bacterium]